MEMERYRSVHCSTRWGKKRNKTFTFSEEDKEDPDDCETVMVKLDNYFVPKVNTIRKRARFHQRSQKPRETAAEYIRSLHDLADTCAFADAKNEHIHDRLVIGILDKELSEKLQLMSDLTLNKGVELVRQSEQVKQHVSEQGANTVCAQVSEVTRKYVACKDKQRHTSGHGHNKWDRGKQGHKCSRCGSIKEDVCPAPKAECRKCRKLGHFAVACCSRVVNKVTAPYVEGEGNPAHLPGEITDLGDSNDAWTVKLPIQGIETNFKIDSGADTSVKSENTFNKLKHKPQLRKQARRLVSKGGTLDCMSHFIATTVWKEKRFRFNVNVLKGSRSCHLLSRNVAAAMGLIK